MYSKIVVLALVCLAVLVTAEDDDRGGGGGGDDTRGEDGGGRGGGKRARGEGRDGRHKGPGGPGCGYEKMKKCCPSLPELLKQDSVNACMPARPDGPPPGGEGERGRGGGPGGPGGFKNRSCMMECAFAANGFTTTGADGKVVLNMDALNAKLTSMATGNWTAVITAAQANCTATPPVSDQNQTCTSGSGEVAHCLLRQMVTNCPDLVDSKECKKHVAHLSEDRHGPGGKRGDRRGGGRNGGRDDEDGGEGGGDGGRRGGRKGGRDGGGGDGSGDGGSDGGRGGRRGGRKGGRDGGNDDDGEGGDGGRGRKGQKDD